MSETPMTDPDKTVPGTLPADEVFTITPAMSKTSKDRAEKEALENAQQKLAEINKITESTDHQGDLYEDAP